MLTPEQIQNLPTKLTEKYAELNEFILRDLARRIADGAKLTDTAEYQLYRARSLGLSNKEIAAKVAEINDISADVVKQLIRSAAQTSDANDKARLGPADGIPLADNAQLQKLMRAQIKYTNSECENLTNTLGFADHNPDGTVCYRSLTDMYRRQMDMAQLKVMNGTTDYTTALRSAVNKLAASGVRTIDYESGCSRTIEAATRNALMTSVTQVTHMVSEQNAEEFGADGWEMSAHRGARPSHAIYQGRQYTNAEYEQKIRGLINEYGCRHDVYPIILGVSKPVYTEEELRNIDPPPFTYEGRQYTAYQAQQQMRRMERAMRKQKNRCIVADASGDKEGFTTASIKLRRQKDIYEDFCRNAGCYTEYERTIVGGYDRHLSGKTGAVTRKQRAFENAQIVMDSDFGDKLRRTAKSVVTRNKVFSYDELDENTTKRFEQGLDTAFPDVKRVLISVKDKTDFAYSNKKNSYYNAALNYVAIRKTSPPSTLAHELFHKIDRMNKITSTSKNGILTALTDDWNVLLRKSNGDVVGYLVNNYSDAFTLSKSGKIILKEKYRGISDIISGLSGGKINLGYRHTADYWSVSGNLERESWAQFGRVYYDNDTAVVQMMQDIFTNFNQCAIIALKGVK